MQCGYSDHSIKTLNRIAQNLARTFLNHPKLGWKNLVSSQDTHQPSSAIISVPF